MDKIVKYVETTEEGIRLDAFLAKQSGLTRSRVQRLLEQGFVQVNGETPRKAGALLRAGDEVNLLVPEERPSDVVQTEMELDIVYEDDQFLVVNKPRGSVVHPAAGHWEDTLVNGLLFREGELSLADPQRPGIVHRLDKDTTGLLVVAKTDEAHASLSAQIAVHSARREYIALVEGGVSQDAGVVDKPIGRNPRDRKKMAVVPGGRPARTHYRLEHRYKKTSLLVLQLETGRTHQIRVHMQSIGHPVCGDALYGFSKSGAGACPLMLHARALTLRHPTTGEEMRFCAPLPMDFMQVLQKQAEP